MKRLLLIFLIIPFSTLQAQDFYRHSNGITIVCDAASVGDTGSVGGVTYTKRTKAQITTSNASTTCTSGITDMSELFENPPNLWNEDISTWDVSDVTNMKEMFYGAAYFNKDITYWDVSNVTNMQGMFSFFNTNRASGYDFQYDLDSWDVSNVTNMNSMFDGTGYNRPLGSWDVSNVTDMTWMFNGTTTYNQNLSNWCVTHISSKPTNINTGSGNPLGDGSLPNWGTCPTSKKMLYGEAGWRLLSIPNNSLSLNDISDDLAIQGITGGSNSGSPANVYLYNNSSGWSTPTSITTNFGLGYGFAVYLFNNSSNSSNPLPFELDVIGTEVNTDITVNLNAGSSGLYTLVGNPFRTRFNTNTITSSGGNIQNNIHFWDNGNSTFTTIDRTTDYRINSWQGFFVETADANVTSITFPSSGMTGSGASGNFFSKVADVRGDIVFVLQSEQTYDEAIKIAFRANATTEWDLDDASKMTPLVPAYATLGFATNDKIKSVESLPYQLGNEVTLPMQLDIVGTQGGFALSWDGLESIPDEWQVMLHDYQDGISINLREADTYTFDAESSVQSKRNPLTILTMPGKAISKTTQDNRFAIIIQPYSVANELNSMPYSFNLEQNYPNPFNPSTTINYTIAKEGMVELSVFNSAGQQVAKLVNTAQVPGNYNATWDASSAPSGIYFYRLEVADGSMTKKMTLIK